MTVRVGVSSVFKQNNTSGPLVPNPSLPHTVIAGTELLYLSIGTQANHAITVQPTFGAIPFVLIGQTTPSGASADTQVFVYCLVNPPVGTQNISYRFGSTPSSSWHTADNWDEVETASGEAGAVQFIDEDVNDDPSFNTIIPGGGVDPNVLVGSCGAVGEDMVPATNLSGFTGFHNDNTGGNAGNVGDHGFYVAELLSGLPAAELDVRWANSDENAGILMTIIKKIPAGVPVLSSPVDIQMNTTEAQGNVSTDSTSGTLYGVVTQSPVTPTTAQIAAGQDDLGAPADASFSVTPPLTGNNILPFAGLVASTQYYIHFGQIDASLNESVPISADGFITNSIPVLSGPLDTTAGDTSSLGDVISDTPNGTIYGVVTQSQTTPNAAQIIAGQDHLGAPADATFNVGAISGTNNLFFTGLVAATQYYTHFVHQDAGGSDSIPISADGFVTNATNSAPVVDAPIPDQVCTVGVPFGPLDVSGNFSDPDGDPMIFTATGLPNGLTISSTGIISGTPTGGFQ